MPSQTKMKRVQHYVPADQMAAMRQLSRLTGVSVSEHLRRALLLYTSVTPIKDILANYNPAQMELDL